MIDEATYILDMIQERIFGSAQNAPHIRLFLNSSLPFLFIAEHGSCGGKDEKLIQLLDLDLDPDEEVGASLHSLLGDVRVRFFSGVKKDLFEEIRFSTKQTDNVRANFTERRNGVDCYGRGDPDDVVAGCIVEQRCRHRDEFFGLRTWHFIMNRKKKIEYILRWHIRTTLPFYLQYPFDSVNIQEYILLDRLDDFAYATLWYIRKTLLVCFQYQKGH